VAAPPGLSLVDERNLAHALLVKLGRLQQRQVVEVRPVGKGHDLGDYGGQADI
jgi:hypothetical protein